MVLGAIAVRGRAHIDWLMLGILAVPLGWVAFRLFVSRRESSAFDIVENGGLVTTVVNRGFLVLTLVAIPMMFWVFLRLLAPEYFAMPNPR